VALPHHDGVSTHDPGSNDRNSSFHLNPFLSGFHNRTMNHHFDARAPKHVHHQTTDLAAPDKVGFRVRKTMDTNDLAEIPLPNLDRVEGFSW
jgi:hypothetical protein